MARNPAAQNAFGPMVETGTARRCSTSGSGNGTFAGTYGSRLGEQAGPDFYSQNHLTPAGR